MTDRYFAKPQRGLAFETLAQWLNEQGESAETVTKKSITCEGRAVKDVLELTKPQVDALHGSEYQQMVNVFRQDASGHVSIYRYFPAWR